MTTLRTLQDRFNADSGVMRFINEEILNIFSAHYSPTIHGLR